MHVACERRTRYKRRVMGRWSAAAPAVVAIAPRAAFARAATLEPHLEVRGAQVTTADVRAAGGTWRTVRWDDLDASRSPPAATKLGLRSTAGRAARRLSYHRASGPAP
jgi:hypothetical protein